MNIDFKKLLTDVASYAVVDYVVPLGERDIKKDIIDFAASDAAYQLVVGSWLEPMLLTKMPGGLMAVKTLGLTAGLIVAEAVRGKPLMDNIYDIKGLVSKAAKVGGSLIVSDMVSARMA